MNQIKKTALLALAGAALVSTANAQYTFDNNDLLLGFTRSTSTTDYIIDLGNAISPVGVNGTSVVDLSGSVSLATLQSLYGTGAAMANLQYGVVGGSTVSPGSIYSTILRTGGAGVASSANTTAAAPGALSIANTENRVVYPDTIGANLLSSSSSTTVLSSDSSSWKSVILPSGTGGTFTEDYHNPDSTYSGTGFLYEDLYQTVGNAGAPTYKGYFTFGSDGTFTFTPATLAVPEPSVYGVFAGAGLLLLSLGRQFTRKQQA